MTVEEILVQLKKLGSESTKKVLMKHGAKEPFFGVKIADLKVIQKKVKKNHELALALYDTGISDAKYLAGLIAEPKKMSKKQLQDWLQKANWQMLTEYTVAWVTAESNYGWELAIEWIGSDNERTASCGWATLSSIVAVKNDEELDMTFLKTLLTEIERSIEKAADRVKYTMNGFIIAIGTYVQQLHAVAVETAKRIGTVYVDMAGTACKVPSAIEYIDKVMKRGSLGKKRKTAIC